MITKTDLEQLAKEIADTTKKFIHEHTKQEDMKEWNHEMNVVTNLVINLLKT